jgi:HK97 family phage prohead protease
MSDFTRAFVADIDVRSEGDGRTVCGIVVPWDTPARVSDGGPTYTEVWQRGAFSKHLLERQSPVKLLSQHDPLRPIGVSTVMREDAAGLYGEFRVSNTQFGNDQLELIRDGALDSFSIGFRPIKHTKRGDTVTRTEAAIRETSVVTFPAFAAAQITGVRGEVDDAALARLLAAVAAADSAIDPFVESLRAADGALDLARALVAQMTEGADPDAESGTPSLAPLARRLDEAVAERGSATSHDAGESEPRKHSGRLLIARNTFRAALIERGIR